MLKNLFLSLFLICTGFFGFNCLEATDVLPQELTYVERLSQTIDLLHQKQDDVWSGYDISQTPIVVSFANGHIYAFNLASKNPVWEKREVQGQTVLFTTEDPWGVTAVAMQDKFPMEGEEVFAFNVGLMQDNKKMDYMPLLVIVHELFHRYQFNEFIEESVFGAYQDRENIENLTLIKLEENILIDFLRAPESEKIEHLKDFVAVHRSRKAVMKSSSVLWENHQQRMEGLADYVSIRSQDAFGIIPEFSGEEHIAKILGSYVQNRDITEFAVKWRHYGVGAALGYGLDHVRAVNWKEKVEKNGISLADQLEQSLRMTSLEIQGRVWKAKHHYQYKNVKKEIAGRSATYQADMTAMMDRYKDAPGVVLMVERPRDVGINGGGNTGGIYHLSDGSTVSVNDSSVSASSDNLWKIEVRAVPFFFQQGNNRWLKVDENLTIFLDGQEFLLKDLLENQEPKNFNVISWKGKSCDFESVDRPGRLEIQNGQIKILL